MEFYKAFPIAVIDEDYEGKTAGGRGMRNLAQAIDGEGFRVVGGITFADARRLVNVFNTESCWLISVDRVEESTTRWQIFAEVLAAKRSRNDRLPIFLFGDGTTAEMVPANVLHYFNAFMPHFEDSAELMARAIASDARSYLERLPPPMFKALMGPIAKEQFTPETIAQKIAVSPFAKQTNGKVRMMVVTNSTYDGLCYNVDAIKKSLGDTVDVLHSDEAWYAYANFHEFYDGYHAISSAQPARSPHAITLAAQSTHKLLAAFSQASMIHVQQAEMKQLDITRFNEAFMMHTSMSPQYGIIASCDVAAAMMEQPAGRAVVQETIDEAMSFRRAMNNVRKQMKDFWRFQVWEPSIADETPSDTKAEWLLKPGDAWHGFDGLSENHVMVDPVKVTILSPGFTAAGEMQECGIPAVIVTKFLSSHRMEIEKTGLYSFLVLFSMGIIRGEWSTLITEFQNFKDLYDANAPLTRALPGPATAHPAAYGTLGPLDLCEQIHEVYRKDDVPKAREMYTLLPEIALRPADAYDQLVKGRVESVDIDEGRTLAVMIVPYPPGIPLIMPGERITTATSIQDYLVYARAFDQKFPGFETDIHGLRFAQESGGRRKKARGRGVLASMTDKYQLPILAVGESRLELAAAPSTENGGDHAGLYH